MAFQYNEVPPVPGVDQNGAPAANVAGWLNGLNPADLNQIGDLAILNASINSGNGSLCSQGSGGGRQYGLNDVDQPSFNSSSSGASSYGRNNGRVEPGALVLAPVGPQAVAPRPDGVNLDLQGVIQMQIPGGTLRMNLPGSGNGGLPAVANLRLEPMNPIDNWVPPAPTAETCGDRLDMNMSGSGRDAELMDFNSPCLNSSYGSSGSGRSNRSQKKSPVSVNNCGSPNSGLAGVEAPSFNSSGSGASAFAANDQQERILAGSPRPPGVQPVQRPVTPNRDQNRSSPESQGLFGQDQPSFASTAESSFASQNKTPSRPASAQSPDNQPQENNYSTPPPSTPVRQHQEKNHTTPPPTTHQAPETPPPPPTPDRGPENIYTPAPSYAPSNLSDNVFYSETPSPASARGPDKHSTPQSAASGQAPENKCTPPQQSAGRSMEQTRENNFTPATPASGQLPTQDYMTPALEYQNREEQFQTPVRQITCAKKLDFSDANESFGGLSATSAPRSLNNSPQDLGQRSGGINSVNQPSLCGSSRSANSRYSPCTPDPLDNYIPPVVNTPCGDNLDLNATGGSGLSGVTIPESLHLSEKSYLQSNFDNLYDSGLRSGLSQVSSPSGSVGSSCVSSPFRVTGTIAVGNCGNTSSPLQLPAPLQLRQIEPLSPIRTTEEYFQEYNFPPPERQGLFAQGEPSFASTGSGGYGEEQFSPNRTPQPFSPASVPSPGNNFTPAPYTPASVPSPGNYFTPKPYSPASVPSPGNYFTPQQPYSPASVPSPGNNFTPPPRGPCSPASVPSPGNNFTPPRPEDNFRTPPRPDVLIGENLNTSHVSNRSGGLEGVGAPDWNDTISSINTPSLASNASNRSGLEGVFQPSFNSTFSEAGSDNAPLNSTTYSQGGRNSPQTSPRSNASNRSGLEGVFQPSLNSTFSDGAPDNAPVTSTPGSQGGRNSPQTSPRSNASNRSGLDSVFMPSFNSTFSEGTPGNAQANSAAYSQGARYSPQASPPDMIQFSPDKSPPNLIQFSPNVSQASGDGEIDRLANFAFGTPVRDGRDFGIRRLPELTPTDNNYQSQYAPASDGEIARMAELAFGTPQTPVSSRGRPTPGTPESQMGTPETSAMNRMVREAHNFLMNMSAQSGGPGSSGPAPGYQSSPESPQQRLRPRDILPPPIRLPNTPYQERENNLWNSGDDRIIQECMREDFQF